MAVLVSSEGKRQTHGAATHFIVSPHGVLFVYTGDENTAVYREWSYAYISMTPGPPPKDAVINDDESEEATETEELKDGLGKVLATKTTRVPRGGFGSKESP